MRTFPIHSWIFTSFIVVTPALTLAAPGETDHIAVRDPNLPDFVVTISEISANGAMSAGGRFVAFSSNSTAIVPGDANGHFNDVFVRDRRTDTTTLVSVDSNGVQGNATSWEGSISADGRFVAFASFATNLVPNDTTADTSDVFLHDRVTGTTTRINLSNSGEEANGSGFSPRISGNGRFIAYGSVATNLVPGDTNGFSDIFLYDRVTHQTTRVTDNDGRLGSLSISFDGRVIAYSVESEPVPVVKAFDRVTGQTRLVSRGIGGSAEQGDDAFVSGDGRWVSFYSVSWNLVPGDVDDQQLDVFLHDLRTGKTQKVSRGIGGTQANEASFSGGLSGDGRFVAFESYASNLVANDTNNTSDVFVFDRVTGKTTLESVSSTGEQANGFYSGIASMSVDGRSVLFQSDAPNFRSDGSMGSSVFLHERRHGSPSGN